MPSRLQRLLFDLSTWLAAKRQVRSTDVVTIQDDQRGAQPRGLAFDRLRGKLRRTWLRVVRGDVPGDG